MRIHKKVKIQQACSDSLKDATGFPHLSIEKGEPTVLVATDGRIASVVPVEPDKDDRSGLIPRSAFSVAQKAAARDGFATLQCKARIHLPDADQTHGRPQVTKPFPNYKPAIPDSGRKGEIEFCVDAHLLFRLALSMGAEWVRLRLVPQKDGQKAEPIRVEAVGVCPVPGAYGSIMPISEADASAAAEKAKKQTRAGEDVAEESGEHP